MSAMLALRSAARQIPRRAPVPKFYHSAIRTLVTKRYTTSHEWISYDDSSNIATMGVTQYAQNALGDVCFVDLPALETEVEAKDQLGGVESVKAASDIYAPISGIVIDRNTALEDKPKLVNSSPEGEGWLVKLKVTNPGEVDLLLSEEAYKTHCEGGEDH